MTWRINSDEKQHRTTGQYDLSYLSPDICHRCSRAFRPATSAFLSRVVLEYSTPRVVAFDMKKTLDSFMDSVSQKQLTEAQSKALSDRFNDALEKSLAEYQHGHSGFTCRGSGRARCDPQHPARHCPPDERRTVMIRLKDCLLAACRYRR